MFKKSFSIYFFTLIAFAILIFGCVKETKQPTNKYNIYKSELEKEIWVTNQIIGLNPEIGKYSLKKKNQKKFAGNLTVFLNNQNFKSYYTSFCGNDYFTTVYGKYNFFEKNKLSVTIDSITYSGEWKKPTEFKKNEEIIFIISKNKDLIILNKEDNFSF